MTQPSAILPHPKTENFETNFADAGKNLVQNLNGACVESLVVSCYLLTWLVTYLLNYLLHGAQSFLRS